MSKAIPVIRARVAQQFKGTIEDIRELGDGVVVVCHGTQLSTLSSDGKLLDTWTFDVLLKTYSVIPYNDGRSALLSTSDGTLWTVEFDADHKVTEVMRHPVTLERHFLRDASSDGKLSLLSIRGVGLKVVELDTGKQAALIAEKLSILNAVYDSNRSVVYYGTYDLLSEGISNFVVCYSLAKKRELWRVSAGNVSGLFMAGNKHIVSVESNVVRILDEASGALIVGVPSDSPQKGVFIVVGTSRGNAVLRVNDGLTDVLRIGVGGKLETVAKVDRVGHHATVTSVGVVFMIGDYHYELAVADAAPYLR